MKITEMKNEGLKREYQVILPASEINGKVELKLKHLAKTIKISGFRPGKVPVKLVKKKHGQAVLSEVLQDAVSHSSEEVLLKKQVQPALKPKIELAGDFSEGQDLTYNMSFEIYPEVPELDYASIKLERSVVDVTKDDIADSIEKIRQSHKVFEPIKEARAAKKGDAVLIDFVGKTNGEVFEGGSGEGFRLELGSDQFIPGFEDQLIGAKKGDRKTVKVTFPEEYGQKDLAGQGAEFDVTVHDILASELPAIDKEFVKKIGYDDVAALEEAVKKQFEGDFAGLAKMKLKKELFDAIDTQQEFNVPQGMLDLEYQSMIKDAKIAPEGGTKEDEKQREEYHKIALRRVRLGITLAEHARKNHVTVTEEELRHSVFEQARNYPGQEQKVIEFYQKNSDALEQLRGPLIEDKVVSIILEVVQISDKKTTVKELLEFSESQDS